MKQFKTWPQSDIKSDIRITEKLLKEATDQTVSEEPN